MREGLCGVLKPNGEFIECIYGQDYKITDELPRKEAEECIVFSSSMREWQSDSTSAIHWDRDMGITQQQYNWIIANKDKCDPTQYKCWIKPLEQFGEKWIKIRK